MPGPGRHHRPGQRHPLLSPISLVLVLVLVWDNLKVHRDARMRAFIEAHDWITVFYLPPYTPQLNPVGGIWSLLRRRCRANTAFTGPDHLMRVLRHGLRQVQYCSDVVDGCLAATGLTLTTTHLQAHWSDGCPVRYCLRVVGPAGSDHGCWVSFRRVVPS